MIDDNQIIHNKCGLPIELCECEDAEIKYNWDKDCFEVKELPKIDSNGQISTKLK